MARVRVEDAGGRLEAASVGWQVRLGRAAGQATVGGRPVGWRVTPAGVEVAHPPGAGGGADERYVVGVTVSLTPTGGRGWAWACPGCGGRAAALYLVPARDRLGCRRCCGLAYASQLTRARGRTRPAGRRVVVETEVLRWTPGTGWVRTVTRRG